jgi:hypothetical protein
LLVEIFDIFPFRYFSFGQSTAHRFIDLFFYQQRIIYVQSI